VLVAHVDVPLIDQPFQQAFYKEAEWIYGEGVATTKGPLAIMEFALNALKHARALSRIKLGVVLYNDEGLSCRYSAGMLRQIFARAGCVLVLRPTTTGASILTDHRGQRIYRFTSEGNPFRIEKSVAQNDLLLCALDSLQSFSRMSLPAKRLSIAPVRISSTALPMHSPHRIEADVIMTYANTSLANEKEQEMLAGLPDKRHFKCELKRITERPPLPRRSINLKLAGEIIQMAGKRDITLSHQSSAWPAVAGLVPASVPVVSGMGPYGRNLCMPNESIERLSLVQRALILATFLASKAEGDIASRKPA
jgi:D-alanine-D-alanine ligase